MIEIDVHERSPGVPVVTHAARYSGKTWFGSLSEEFCHTVRALRVFLDENNGCSPIILDFEFGALSSETQINMAGQLESGLGGHLVSGSMDFRTSYPRDFKGKVIMTCGGGATRGLGLRNMMNVLQREDYWFKNSGYPRKAEEEEDIREWITSTNGFSRVYPRNFILSANVDGVEVMEKLGTQAVAMNYGVSDCHLARYRAFFKGQELEGYRPRNV